MIFLSKTTKSRLSRKKIWILREILSGYTRRNCGPNKETEPTRRGEGLKGKKIYSFYSFRFFILFFVQQRDLPNENYRAVRSVNW